MSKTARTNKKTSIYMRNISNLANGFPSPIKNILKAFYMAKCESIESSSGIPKSEDYLTIACPACHIDISETAKFDLIPKKCGKFTQRLRKRLENGSPLTNYQTSYAKHLPTVSHDGQIAFNITCDVCHKSIKKIVSKWKQRSVKRKAVDEPSTIEISQMQPKQKKRKKKIDQFCGLSTEAVKSIKDSSSIPIGQNKKVSKISSKKSEEERQRPFIVNNINHKKKKSKNNHEMLKNKNKLGQILGLSLAQNSGKSNHLNNFFGSF